MIKVIETNYKGVKFRSRLEARWAVFFDEPGIKFQYEPEGFSIDGVCYLPDFYLPDYSCWVEIKPEGYIWKEDKKIIKFSEQTDKKFILVVGSPQQSMYTVYFLADPSFSDEEMGCVWGDRGEFALARRASQIELCILFDFDAISCGYNSGLMACNLIDISTDDGERLPVIKENMEKAYEKAMGIRFF